MFLVLRLVCSDNSSNSINHQLASTSSCSSSSSSRSKGAHTRLSTALHALVDDGALGEENDDGRDNVHTRNLVVLDGAAESMHVELGHDCEKRGEEKETMKEKGETDERRSRSTEGRKQTDMTSHTRTRSCRSEVWCVRQERPGPVAVDIRIVRLAGEPVSYSHVCGGVDVGVGLALSIC